MQPIRDAKQLVMIALSHSQHDSPSSDTTTSNIESTLSKTTLRGDPKHGGALFTLPREIRDEIYRVLVKGRHNVYFNVEDEEGGTFTKPTVLDKPDLVILQIPRAISHEAGEILYSESVFRYGMNFKASKVLQPPAHLVSRMKKVKMLVGNLTSRSDSRIYRDTHPSYIPRMTAIFKATFDNFLGAQTLRDTCHVQLTDFEPGMTKQLSSYILPKLKDFTGFRTVLVEICLEEKCLARVQWECSQSIGSEKKTIAKVGRVRWAIKNAMEPTLGPATDTDNGYAISLEFHPRQHVPALFRTQAQQLLLDADRLEQDG